MSEYHGDEPEIEAHSRELKEAYDEEHADDDRGCYSPINDWIGNCSNNLGIIKIGEKNEISE